MVQNGERNKHPTTNILFGRLKLRLDLLTEGNSKNEFQFETNFHYIPVNERFVGSGNIFFSISSTK